MRVLMLTNMYPHEEDPAYGAFVYEQVRALRALGVEIDVIFVNGRANRWNYLMGYLRFWRQLAFVQYDLIHAHYVFSGWIARAQLRLPVVQSFHAPGEMDTYQGWLCRRLAPLVDAAIVTSEEHRSLLGYKAHVIPCGVDLDLFVPMPKREARERVGWEEKKEILAWIGEPRREKRLDLARETYQVLQPRHPDAELKVVSRVPHEEVVHYMNAADVLLLTSDYEGSPVTIKEAMACNLPIVSTRVGDVPQVLRSTEGCYLAEHTPQDLAKKVEAALNFGPRTRGREAIWHLQTHGEARRILDLYNSLLSCD